MNLKVKSGYILVKLAAPNVADLDDRFSCGIIEVGPDQDLGVKVYFKDHSYFGEDLLIVRVEDVVAWELPVTPEVVAEDTPAS